MFHAGGGRRAEQPKSRRTRRTRHSRQPLSRFLIVPVIAFLLWLTGPYIDHTYIAFYIRYLELDSLLAPSCQARRNRPLPAVQVHLGIASKMLYAHAFPSPTRKVIQRSCWTGQGGHETLET